MTITFANYPVHWIGEACIAACRVLIQPAACSPAGACSECSCAVLAAFIRKMQAPGSWLLANWSKRSPPPVWCLAGHNNHHLQRINCSGPAAHLPAPPAGSFCGPLQARIKLVQWTVMVKYFDHVPPILCHHVNQVSLHDAMLLKLIHKSLN